MKKYQVSLTAVYNGSYTIEANSQSEAITKVQELLTDSNLIAFQDKVRTSLGTFFYGETIADWADEIKS